MSRTAETSGTRRDLLEAALALLAEGNVDALTMGAVAARAGVSRQAVYLHFPSWGALVMAAVRYTDEREDVGKATEPLRRATTAEELLDAYAAFLGDYNPRIAGVVRMAFRLRTKSPEFEAAWQDRLEARRAGGESIARQLQAWGRLSPAFTVRAAGDWLCALGSVLLWDELTLDLGWSSKRFVQHLADSARATLLVGPRHPAGRAVRSRQRASR